MAVGDVQIALPNGPAPTSKQVVGQDAVQPKAVNASFDGSGAAGPFLPCLVITGKEGFEVARIPAAQVAAGASAEVSWFPRVGGAGSSTGDGGLLFGGANPVYGPHNKGQLLDVDASLGMKLQSDFGNILLYSFGAGVTQLLAGGGVDIQGGGTLSLTSYADEVDILAVRDVNLFSGPDYAVQLRDSTGNPVVLSGDFAGAQQLGFFGAYVTKQVVAGSRGGNAALASLLTALANYGLIVNNTTL